MVLKRLVEKEGRLFLNGNHGPAVEVTEDIRIQGVVCGVYRRMR